LREAGWECWYVPSAVAYHGRTSRGLGEKAYLAALLEFHRNQRHKSQLVKVNSMKNQWLMLVKNEDPSNLVRDLPFICARELAILAYTAAFSPRALIAIPRFARALPSALRKRRAIKARQVTPPRELRCWFGA